MNEKQLVNSTQVIKGNVCVEMTYIGEGINGGYNPNDPKDIPFMRFYIKEFNGGEGWDDIEYASYCTLIPATESEESIRRLAEVIMNAVYEPASNGIPMTWMLLGISSLRIYTVAISLAEYDLILSFTYLISLSLG